MHESDDRLSSDTARRAASEPMIFVMPAEGMPERSQEEIRLLDLWNVLWQGKWLIIGVTAAFAALSVVLALTATEWYRVEVLLVAADERSTSAAGQLGGLGGLVSLAGISVGGGGNVEPIAVLRSRDFTRAFIEDMHLLPVLFAEAWDAENGRWMVEDPADQPDIRDAIRFFDQNVRSVSEDTRTSLVTLSIEWTDPEIAAEWANSLVIRLNQHMRQRALAEAEANVAYLEKELADTNVATLRQSIGRLLETELQKLMLARGSEEFAFRVIDAAEVPKIRERPKRTLFVMSATAIGGLLSVFFVFIRNAVRQSFRSGARGATVADSSIA